MKLMHNRILYTLLIAAVMFATESPDPVLGQAFRGLGFIPGDDVNISIASGISADGQAIAGSSNVDFASVAARWTEDDGWVALGRLPGGTTSSATAVSNGGTTVVGWSGSQDGTRAFRWTDSGGMAGLGILPGGLASFAYGASADGTVVVGGVNVEGAAVGEKAFRWTPAGGMRELGALPGGTGGGRALAVSADGSTIVGYGAVPGATPQAFRWSDAEGMVALGSPQGNTLSEAYAVSADGSVVVGRAFGGVAQAFRWTESGGMQGMGNLPGFAQTRAVGVSEDGSTIVGYGESDSETSTFIWTEETGMRSLVTVLQEDYGVNIAGWRSLQAQAISSDGFVIVGLGINPDNELEAWRAQLTGVLLDSPGPDTLLIAGEQHRISWQASPSVQFVDLILLPDTLGAAPVTIDFGLPAADTSYLWSPPDTLFSRSARLVIHDTNDQTVADTSTVFRLRPYHVVRASSDETRYEAFDVDRHGWSFGNEPEFLFPYSWYQQQQFNYFGSMDPFSLIEYDSDFTAAPIHALSSDFADWPAYVRAFGIDAAYWALLQGNLAVYKDAFVSEWAAEAEPWGGSCYGLAVSSLLAFTHREAFGAAYPVVGPEEEIAFVSMNAAVREAISTLYSHQSGLRAFEAQRANLFTMRTTPRETLARFRSTLSNDSTLNEVSVLTMKDVGNCTPLTITGGHAVTPYRLEREDADASRWRLYVYDSNRPGDETAYVVVDSTANTWSYTGFTPAWGGACGLFLRDPIANYLDLALVNTLTVDKLGSRDGVEERPLRIATNSDLALTATDGRQVGHAAGRAFNDIEGAWAEVSDVGGLVRPKGYQVPMDTYRIELSAFPSDSVSVFVFDEDFTYAYGRTHAAPDHIDRLAYSSDDGLMARNDDASVTKTVSLRGIVPAETSERTLDVRDLALAASDSVRFTLLEMDSTPSFRLTNMGGGTTYTIRLRLADTEGAGRFRYAAVPIAAGATHTARPDWSTVGDENAVVSVDVDSDSDGVPEQTLVLRHQPVANEVDASHSLPLSFALGEAYPNPFQTMVTIPFDVPAAGHVRLAAYNLLGRQVAILVDGERGPGQHVAHLHAGELASGIYLIRLATATELHTRRVMLVR